MIKSVYYVFRNIASINRGKEKEENKIKVSQKKLVHQSVLTFFLYLIIKINLSLKVKKLDRF